MFRVVLWLAFVCFSTHGFPHGGRVAPVNKRSDYSMYDNQFFSVGDTKLDNEVTDCALVRHQYARGYIRLREFLERMEGCGKKGQINNVAGIAASIKDAIYFPSNNPSVPKAPVVKAAPFKPRPIGEVIENANSKKPQISAYQNPGLKAQQPIPQQGSQRSQTGFNNFGVFNQEYGPLSYSPNPATSSIQSPLARKIITRKNMNIPQEQALHNLASKKKDFPDPQRYYSDQVTAMARPASVTVGQPLVKSNPLPLTFHQQLPLVASITQPVQPQANQLVNPDKHVDKVNQLIKKVISQSAVKLVKPVKQAIRVQSGKLRDDIGGGQLYDEGMQDEANEAQIDSEESDPLPPETSFTYNPTLEEEDTSKNEDAKIDAENSNPNNLPNTLASTPSLNNVPENIADQGNNDDISNGPLLNKEPKQAPKVNMSPQKSQDTHNEPKNEQKSQPPAPQKPQNVQQTPNVPKNPQNVQQTPNVPKNPQNVQTPTQNTPDKMPQPPSIAANPDVNKGDDLQGNSEPSNKQFLKPAPSSNVNQNEPENNAQPNPDKPSPDTENQSAPATSTPNKKPKGLAINLGVLKNRISSSRDIGFLKRMLTLIKKITHHKDFDKLGGVQKSAIMQAGEAVNNAVAKSANIQRSFIQPRPPQWKPGDYTMQRYVSPSYGASSGVQNNLQAATQRNTQKSLIQSHPPKWKPGDYTGQNYASSAYTGSQVKYGYPAYQTSVQYHPPHWKPGDYTASTGSTNAQLYNAKQPQITKKFQIERNPYYQTQVQRPAAYRPPYFSLQRLNYGLYNGNVP